MSAKTAKSAAKGKKWKADDPAQSKRFLEAAGKAEASDDSKDLERVIKKIAPRRRKPS